MPQVLKTREIADLALQQAPQCSFKGKLVIFTSFYDFKGHAPYFQSVMALGMVLEALGVRYDFWPVFGDFLIERCVNDTYTRFMQDEEASHILTIDSDESFDPAAVVRMLNRDVDVVGAAYRMKGAYSEWTANWLSDPNNGQPQGKVFPEIMPDGNPDALLKARHLPWGFLLVSKEVLNRYVAHYADDWYNMREGDGVRRIFDFCQLTVRNRGLYSQDCGFSERLREMGEELWLDPNVTIGHWGQFEYRGNLRQHLLELAADQSVAKAAAGPSGSQNEIDAFATVRQMAREIEERKAA